MKNAHTQSAATETNLSIIFFIICSNANMGSFYGLDHDRTRFLGKIYYLRLRPGIPEIPGFT